MLSVNEVLEIALILDGNRYNKLYYAGLMIGIVLLIIMIMVAKSIAVMIMVKKSFQTMMSSHH